TYLAMRAVEYEFQQSLALRTQILTAFHPDQLEAALQVLQQEQAGRTINRRRPEDSNLVLSLRDDILHIADRSAAPEGERAWEPARRFKGRLVLPQYAIYNDAGDYIGQGVHFAVDPTAGGAENGIALPNRCAERLWQVTATIQGDSLSSREPGAPVFLLKRNEFSSQWCSGLSDGTPLQTASIPPSRQLFQPSDSAAPVDQSQSFSTAVLFPWFNVRRSDFFREAYAEGASQELAGRGLYGDYILLFPKELIDKKPIDNGPIDNEPSDTGFSLENVED